MSKEALVVERNVLFKNNYFRGFVPLASNTDYINIILANYKYHQRGDQLENNPNLQQIIPYVWLVNQKTKQIFVYKRANNPNYTEKRLRNKISCGLGGHIDKADAKNPIMNAMARELKEEVKMSHYPKPKILGFINEDETEVGKVHFGICAIAETTENAKKGDDEMSQCKMCSIKEVESLFSDPENDVESWTQISWPFVKNYLESRN
ncbi:NUDIX domain-containing protein [Candidatus Pacearchaeota archaeon]|nr:NUDIX domain-containing protein [Candidatus Pacearchaeota archaeon]